MLQSGWSLVPRAEIIATICAALYIVTSVIQRIIAYNRLRAFKGPLWASLSSTWLAKETLASRLYLSVFYTNSKYGSLARIGPNLLVTSDPVLLRRMNAARSPYTRGQFYGGVKLGNDVPMVISERDEQKHSEMRARLASGYGGKDNPNLEKSIDDRVLDVISLIERKYLSQKGEHRVLDMAKLAQYFTMDVLSDVAFSKPFAYLKADADLYDYVDTIETYMKVLELRVNVPPVNAVLGNKYLMKLLAPSAKDKMGLGRVMGIANEIVAERFGPDAKVSDDMLGSFIRHGLSQPEAEAEALMQVMAGTDTTATAVRCIMYYIVTNHRVYTSLQKELDKAALTRPVLRDTEARQLPYLQAVIQEGLRVWPPITGLQVKLSPPEGDNYDGRFIPGNTNIGYSAWAMHHSRELYGEDADIFRPERWLEAEGEKLNAMTRSVELVFGMSGEDDCIS